MLAEDRLAELHCLPEKVYIQDKNAFFNDGRLGKQKRKLLSAAQGLQKNLYFSLPGTQLSVDFFKEQVWGQCTVAWTKTMDVLMNTDLMCLVGEDIWIHLLSD